MHDLGIVLAAASVVSCASIDDVWEQWMKSPPVAAVTAAANLSRRADALVARLTMPLAVNGDVDVVVSGGGDFDAYYMGIDMILSRAEASMGGGFTRQRYAGASAGGMMPFEVYLKGQNLTLSTHIAYGMLEEQWPIHFSNVASAAALQDHHWRIMAAWQAAEYNTSLSKLDGRIFLALSCLDPLPKLVKVSNFTSIDQATRAFMATGTYEENYDGMICSDGGAESGKNMTPLFQDKLRPQLIVNLMQTGFPDKMGLGKFNSTQYIELIRRGQDEAAEFLQKGTVQRSPESITLCPTSATVTSNVCEISD